MLYNRNNYRIYPKIFIKKLFIYQNTNIILYFKLFYKLTPNYANR